MLLCMLPLGLMLFLHLFHEQARIVFSPEIIGLLFSGLSLIIGVLGGMHFGLAVSVTASTGVAVEKIGGALYALDLTGSAAGALIASLFMIPIYGLMNTLVVVSVMSGFSALTLLKRP
jgi:predicted membrane-bound spermidine synthase